MAQPFSESRSRGRDPYSRSSGTCAVRASQVSMPGCTEAHTGAVRAGVDFPGYESLHLPASEIDHYEGRLEFWDGRTETAWKVCEPTSIQHEGPSRRLVRMAERVVSLRGSRASARRTWCIWMPRATGSGTAAGAGDRRGPGHATGRGAGGGPQHGRTPAQARDLPGERISEDPGTGAVGVVGARARAHDLCSAQGRIPGGGGERGLSRVARMPR